MPQARTRSKSSLVGTYVRQLEALLEHKRTKDRQQLFKQGQRIINIIIKFVKQKRCLIYGGYALNSILPQKDRFYDKLEIPDVDFFSPSAKQHAIELADYFMRSGFNYVEVRSGIHYETFKVYVNFIPVADITEVPKKLFSRMKRMSEEERKQIMYFLPGFDLPVAPLAFLRLSMHLELSRPEGFVERWVKVYKRMTLLYDYYPIKYDARCVGFRQHTSERVPTFKRQLLQFVRQSKLPIIGVEAIKMYLKHGGMHIECDWVLHPNMSL